MGASFCASPGVSSFSWMAHCVKLYLRTEPGARSSIRNHMEGQVDSHCCSVRGGAGRWAQHLVGSAGGAFTRQSS